MQETANSHKHIDILLYAPAVSGGVASSGGPAVSVPPKEIPPLLPLKLPAHPALIEFSDLVQIAQDSLLRSRYFSHYSVYIVGLISDQNGKDSRY